MDSVGPESTEHTFRRSPDIDCHAHNHALSNKHNTRRFRTLSTSTHACPNSSMTEARVRIFALTPPPTSFPLASPAWAAGLRIVTYDCDPKVQALSQQSPRVTQKQNIRFDSGCHKMRMVHLVPVVAEQRDCPVRPPTAVRMEVIPTLQGGRECGILFLKLVPHVIHRGW